VPTKVNMRTSNRSVPLTPCLPACARESHHSTLVLTLSLTLGYRSPLLAHLALISTREDETNGVFFVNARTSNSPLALNFTEQPPDALLKLEAHTSNSPARVQLHPSFEGTFKLRTSIFPAFVSENDDVEDPAGRDRKRVVHVKTVGRGARIVHGDVEWVPEDEAVAPAGRVEVSTSHSPLRLLL